MHDTYDMTTMTAYKIAPAPKNAGMREWDCQICEHETLKRPVFIDNGSGVISAGSGCAAKALGLVRSDHTGRLPSKVVNEMASQAHKAKVEAELTQERIESATRALSAYNVTAPFGHGEDDLQRWFSNFRAAKRFGKVPMNAEMRPYLEAAAATGEV